MAFPTRIERGDQVQPTNLQVRRSLEALAAGGQTDDPVASSAATAARLADADVDLWVEVVAGLGDAPVIRPERLQEARQRLADGEQPTADALADRMVGRLVCDRLR